MGDSQNTSSEGTKFHPFFGSSSSETDLLPNFFLRFDFTDRGELETSNKEKVDLFWKYIESKTNLSSLMVLPDKAVKEEKSILLEEQNENNVAEEMSKNPWSQGLKQFERLGFKATASAAVKGCNGNKKAHMGYKPQPSDNALCLDLCKWGKEYRQKILNDPPPHWTAYKKHRES